MTKVNILNKTLADYTHQIATKRSQFIPFVAYIIYAIEKTCSDKEINSLKDFFREVIQKFPESSELLSVYPQLQPHFIFSKIYPIVETHLKNKLTSSYLGLFGISTNNKSSLSEEQLIELLNTIKNFPKIFAPKASIIQQALENMFFELPYLSIFKDNASQNLYITSAVINKFISSITIDDLNQDKFKEKLDLLFDLKIEDRMGQVLQRISDLTQAESAQPVRDQLFKLAESVKQVTQRYKTEIDQLTDKSAINQISANVTAWYQQDSDWIHRSIYTPCMLNLKHITGNGSLPNLDNQIYNFVIYAPFDAYKRINEPTLKQIVSEYTDAFGQAAAGDLRILNLARDKILTTELTPPIAQHLIAKLETLPLDQKYQYFDAISKLKLTDSSLIARFHTQLMSVKSINPEFVKKYINLNRGRFFNRQQKIELRS